MASDPTVAMSSGGSAYVRVTAVAAIRATAQLEKKAVCGPPC
jgi:hypothetical protein